MINALSFQECHQLYMPGKYPFGYIGPARFQRLSGDKVHIWIHPSSKLQFMKALLEYYNLEKQENTEEDLYKNSEIKVSIDAENICRFHLSGPKCLSKLRDSIRFVNDEKFSSEHNYFLSVSDSVFQSSRDGEVINLLIEDPRTTWDRKTVLKHKKVNKEADNERIRVSKFWNKEFREMAIEKRYDFKKSGISVIQLFKFRMADSEFHKQNSSKINGVISTEAKVPIILIIRNEGLKALDGADILIPEPFGIVLRKTNNFEDLFFFSKRLLGITSTTRCPCKWTS